MRALPPRIRDRLRRDQEKEMIDPNTLPRFTVFLAPSRAPEEPDKFEHIVDLLKMPHGGVKMVDVNGTTFERTGEVIRVRMDELPTTKTQEPVRAR